MGMLSKPATAISQHRPTREEHAERSHSQALGFPH
jgi:hypothetical protein